jgi:glutathione peroxidase
MNKLAEDFASGLAVVGVYCNQFGFQTNEGPAESLKILADIRPGNGFVPKMDLYSKVNVNGASADPLFKWMRSVIKIPQDPPGDSKGNGCDDVDLIISARSAFDGVTLATWSPVTRTDIAWNFEKFLFSKEGELVKRYSRFYSTEAIAADIQKLL